MKISRQSKIFFWPNGSLISVNYLVDFGATANKRCQISPLSRKFEFPALYSKQLILIKFDFAPFDGNGTKVKIPSEIKPPLVRKYSAN